MQPTWTIQAKRGESVQPIRKFATKREAVSAMEADRQPKTAIVKDGHHYAYTARTN
jgi:hypothetical protein